MDRIEVKKVTGEKAYINLSKLNRLRFLADWQIMQAGYDPASITAACLKFEA